MLLLGSAQMPQKIFISYRRQDTAANALGIGQYLEHEFGRKSVFIDVDMRAGAKFPEGLEQRLAECKVMLVLIGPEWLNSRDEQGRRRLESSDDWVRLEIAHALRRDITVIPVRVNGVELPARAALPEDIRGLLDHQAVSTTTAGFRNEMSGLVRDIRSIPSPRPWRRYGAIAAGFLLLLLLSAVAAVQAGGLSNVFESLRRIPFLQTTNTSQQNDIWTSSPGEWVLYGVDKQPVGYYFKAGSIRQFGDNAVITSRFPFKPTGPTTTTPLGAYQEDQIVVDCKNHTFSFADTTTYNTAGQIVSHLKRADPETLNASAGQSIVIGSVISAAERVMCNQSVRTSLAERINDPELTYYSRTATSDGDVFYGPAKKLPEVANTYVTLFVTRLYQDHPIRELFPAPPPLFNAPQTYRTYADVAQFNCTDRTVNVPKVDNFDSKGNLVYINASGAAGTTTDLRDGSAFWAAYQLICSGQRSGTTRTYQGMIDVTYKGAKSEQQITLTIDQNGNELKVNYNTGSGGQGKGTGALNSTGTESSMSLQSTLTSCPGSYEASFKFADDALSFSFKGQDCAGAMEGLGTAKRTKV